MKKPATGALVSSHRSGHRSMPSVPMDHFPAARAKNVGCQRYDWNLRLWPMRHVSSCSGSNPRASLQGLTRKPWPTHWQNHMMDGTCFDPANGKQMTVDVR